MIVFMKIKMPYKLLVQQIRHLFPNIAIQTSQIYCSIIRYLDQWLFVILCKLPIKKFKFGKYVSSNIAAWTSQLQIAFFGDINASYFMYL